MTIAEDGWSRREVLTDMAGGLARASLGLPVFALTETRQYDKSELRLVVNGTEQALRVDAGVSLLDLLREQLGLVGTETRFTASQPRCSVLWRAPERELFPLTEANGISHVVWSPLAEGVLAGKYTPRQVPPPGTRAANGPDQSGFIGELMNDRALEAVQRLRPIADGLALGMAQPALAWVRRRPEVASAIVGASRPEQLCDLTSASGVALDEVTLAAIEHALGDVPQQEPALAVFAAPALGAPNRQKRVA